MGSLSHLSSDTLVYARFVLRPYEDIGHDRATLDWDLLLATFGDHPPAHPEALLNLFVPSGGWPVLRCLPEFFLGIVTARVYTQRSEIADRLSGWTGNLLLLAMLLLLMLRWSDFYFVALCPLLILSMTSKSGTFVRFASSGPIRHLGLISYSVYLVHDLLGG